MTSYLVTGGAGTLGQAFVRSVLADPDTARVCVYSRDEEKHRAMMAAVDDERVRYFLGDVRDRDRLRRAMQGCDTIVHAAALKQVPAIEYNPEEAVKTNVDGTRNVISAALDTDSVERVVLVSTDKACSPTNAYGATKALAEKLMVASNAYSGAYGPKFCAVRYGNVFGSRGSVLHVWREAALRGETLSVTHRDMTRFFFTLGGAVGFVRECLARTQGGEIWIPKLPSFRVTDLREAVAPLAGWRETGVRPGEKLHESMVSEDEGPQALDCGDRYAICPPPDVLGDRIPEGAVKVPEGFRYRSDENEVWLSVEELRGLLAEYVGRKAA